MSHLQYFKSNYKSTPELQPYIPMQTTPSQLAKPPKNASAKNNTPQVQDFSMRLPNVLPFQFGFSTAQGRRPSNEDAEIAFSTENYQGCAIFDGHGGSGVSQLCARLFPDLLERNFDAQKQISRQIIDFASVLKQTVADLDELILQNQQFNQQGSTLTLFALYQSRAYILNIGDSKTILQFTDRFFASVDHKPTRHSETERILKLQRNKSQKTLLQNFGGVTRLNGNLSLSRAIGDAYERANGIVSQPEIFSFLIDFDGLLDGKQLSRQEFEDPDLFNYSQIAACVQDLKFVVQGCDGLFDVLEAEEVVQVVKALTSKNSTDSGEKIELARAMFNGQQKEVERLARKNADWSSNYNYWLMGYQANAKETKKRVCEVLIGMAILAGSQDNVSVVLGLIE